ncbi:MAG: SMC-Scp complex subunit ScpB [Candidatus Paceibacterota bacterium]
MDTTNNISIDARIEALLFYSGEEFHEKDLAELLDISKEELDTVLTELQRKLEGRGLTLLRQNERVQLGTHPASADLLERYREQQFSQSLGKAALETLTIILYEAPTTKADIDYLRGVNSATTLRQLLARGLIEKVPTDEGKRGTCYGVTTDTLRHLGISSPTDLPHYKEMKGELEEVREYQEQTDA